MLKMYFKVVAFVVFSYILWCMTVPELINAKANVPVFIAWLLMFSYFPIVYKLFNGKLILQKIKEKNQ